MLKLVTWITANLLRAAHKPEYCQSTSVTVDSQNTSESAVSISAWFLKLQPNAVSFIVMDEEKLGPDCAQDGGSHKLQVTQGRCCAVLCSELAKSNIMLHKV